MLSSSRQRTPAFLAFLTGVKQTPFFAALNTLHLLGDDFIGLAKAC